MTPAAIEKRLAEIRSEVAQIAPPAPVPGCEWLAWAMNDELLAMERLLGPDPHVEPTPADWLRIQAIMLQAVARMVAASRMSATAIGATDDDRRGAGPGHCDPAWYLDVAFLHMTGHLIRRYPRRLVTLAV